MLPCCHAASLFLHGDAISPAAVYYDDYATPPLRHGAAIDADADDAAACLIMRMFYYVAAYAVTALFIRRHAAFAFLFFFLFHFRR